MVGSQPETQAEENVMTSKYTQPEAQLLTYGDPSGETEWPNYLSLGFTEEHIPELIKMAIDEGLHWTVSESLEVWAPVHAWRTLGQLRAEQAIEPLLALFDFADDFDDDWAPLELPTVYAMIGTRAIPALLKYLSDNAVDSDSCITAIDCLNEIGKTHADAKSECIQAFRTQLRLYKFNHPTLNAFLISGLVNLEAVDQLPLIRKAFNKKRVDLSILGDLEEIEVLFGVRTRLITQVPGFFVTASEPPSISENANVNRQPNNSKIGRNDPCPCGSGRKYKKCCFKKMNKHTGEKRKRLFGK